MIESNRNDQLMATMQKAALNQVLAKTIVSESIEFRNHNVRLKIMLF